MPKIITFLEQFMSFSNKLFNYFRLDHMSYKIIYNFSFKIFLRYYRLYDLKFIIPMDILLVCATHKNSTF